MKIHYFLLVYFCTTLTAIAQKKEELNAFFWGDNDTYKGQAEIPEKFKNESAVIIYKYEDYDFHKFGKNVTYRAAFRKRIKLQDQAAVNEFSELTYDNKSDVKYGIAEKTTIGIKVLKTNGKEIEIDVEKESVALDQNKKIAIPNLEVNDIIDIYHYSTESFQSFYEYGFDEVERTFGDNYPIMNYKLTFQTENDFFVNFNTYNGGPELKQIPLKNNNERKYEIVVKDIDKNDFPNWFYPLAELPCYKFQVFFARSGKFEERAEAFLSEKENSVKKTVSKEDILDFYINKFRPLGNLKDIDDFLKDKTFKTTEEKVRAVYYFTRHYYYTMYIEAFVINEVNIMNPFELYGANPVFFKTEKAFINHFMAFLKENKIEYDIIVATNRNNGPIKDILIQKNASVLLRINTENPFYIEYFTPFSDVDQIASQIENTEAYALKVSKLKKVDNVEEIKLPASTFKDNTSKQVTNITIAPDFNSLNIDRRTSLNGHTKESEQAEKLYFFDYIGEDYEKYGTTPLLDRIKNKKRKEQYTNEFEAFINKLKDKQKEELKFTTSREYQVEIEDHTYKIVNTGRFGKETPFVYDEKFSIKNNLLKKAGNNYIVEIGKFIGAQVEVSQKEKNRTNNVYYSYPRSFENEILLKIPDGYTVSGIEKLNTKIENETGGFIATAKVEGNILKINALKYYKGYFQPQNKWSQIVAFLELSYQFNQEKILLKKN
ncbi:hypothetical protein ACFS5J_02120 [Flavobacterium chuncheonense]|uniref:DUF3857 domain-containing protein n=1 Tax=Flavobacterium chuncheonense TaxID=2026653 RepID=A0ABW5YID5_9FLAO